ncbi:zinc-binding alcohol dehydrogenase [Alkalihalophilus pseudofirmus]|nr:zinc-binding alcohol dehydrogenase [Alkalihalophilus pseudofirmus]
MGKKMKAAVLKGAKQLEIQMVEIPEIGPKDVLLKIKAVGICGSDMHSYREGLYSFPNQIMGHEFCGEVVEVGKDVTDISLGERATGFTVSYCGECYYCQKKDFRMCPQLFENFSGYGKPGAMAEYLRIENAQLDVNLFKVPDHLSDEVAATAEPLGTAIYTMLRTKPTKEDKVVIIGAGLIGNLITQVMKTVPVSKIIVTEVSKQRLETVKEMGADVVVDVTSTENLLAVIQEHTGIGKHHFGEGGMADIVIDAAAAPVTFNQSLDFVRSKGTVGLVGIPEKNPEVNSARIIHKDIRVVGILGSIIPKGLEYLSKGLVKTEPLITHRFSLEQAVEAFETLETDPTAVKVMIKP